MAAVASIPPPQYQFLHHKKFSSSSKAKMSFNDDDKHFESAVGFEVGGYRGQHVVV